MMIKQLMIELTRNRQEHQFHSIEEALTDCFRHDEMKKSFMDIDTYLLKTKSSVTQYQWFDKNEKPITNQEFHIVLCDSKIVQVFELSNIEPKDLLKTYVHHHTVKDDQEVKIITSCWPSTMTPLKDIANDTCWVYSEGNYEEKLYKETDGYENESHKPPEW